MRGRGRRHARGPARALPAVAPAPPDRGARRAALPPGTRLRLGLHRPRPGGRGGRARATRSGPTTSARRSTASSPATSRAASRRRRRSATSSARATPPRAAATATCTSASPSAASSRSSRCSATSARSTVGAALAFKRRREPRVALTFWGDGAMSTGDVHEGLNLAAVLKVPAVFVLQSNGYAYSTPTTGRWSTRAWPTASRAAGASPPRASTAATRSRRSSPCARAVEEARAGGGPRAVEAVTLRLHGHAAHDDGSYMDQAQLRDYSEQRDPIERLAARLRLDGLSEAEVEALRATAADEVSAGLHGRRGLAGARPGDDARRRLRDEADVSDAAAIAERVRAFVRDVVIPAEARDEAAEHGPSPALRDELQAAARAAGLFAPHVGTAYRRARARRARAGARVRGSRLQPARPARAQLRRARRGQHAPARGGRRRRRRRSATCDRSPQATCAPLRHDRARPRRRLRPDDAAHDRAASTATAGSSTGTSGSSPAPRRCAFYICMARTADEIRHDEGATMLLVPRRQPGRARRAPDPDASTGRSRAGTASRELRRLPRAGRRSARRGRAGLPLRAGPAGARRG